MNPPSSVHSPADFTRSTWDEIAPLYAALADRPLDRDNVEDWLRAWSHLEEALVEAAALAMIAYTCDTADPAKEAAHLRFSGGILPRVEEQEVRLAGRLLALGYTRPDLEVTLARLRTQRELFRPENVPLMSALEELGTSYQKITGAITVPWEGQEKTIPQLQIYLRSPDRAVRERAFRSASGAYVTLHDQLADLFDQLFALRSRIAGNAGFSDFRDYTFRAKCRFDYSPADCARFQRAVEQVVVPAVGRILERRRRRLQVETLRPWDLGADLERRDPLRPFGEVGELIAKSRMIFDRVAPVLGREFQILADEHLLDLGSRKGKAPGGYCEMLHFRGRPFIFMNAVGVAEDVSTLLHESGHAFHAFAAHSQPLIWQRQPGMEMCELASMSMELLASPYLGVEQGGFFRPHELARARIEHLEDILLSLTHIASVDAFQSWIYTSGQGGDRDARDRAWLEIRRRFEPALDWSGLGAERLARWYRQLHIFLYPFYYIEYGIAQLGALQIWRNSLHDQADAVRRYRSALALGATRPLPALYQAAGARLTFDAATIGELATFVERHIEAWEAGIAELPAA
ncbi:MAG: M3 family oligoendopeptidase [Gemmatimonadales bacterium]